MIFIIYSFFSSIINPLSANPTKWSDTLKQFVDCQRTNCLSVLDHFVGLTLKRLIHFRLMFYFYTPWKHQKTSSFPMFSRGADLEHWLQMG